MKKISILPMVFGCLLLGGQVVHAAPNALNDAVLGLVTAGTAEQSASGGVIVGNSSSANIQSKQHLGLTDGVQSAARGMNVVNTLSSAVANGVNVWDGRDMGLATVRVLQQNEFSQKQQDVAALSDYSRVEAETVNIKQFAGSSEQEVARTENHTARDVHISKNTSSNTAESTVDTSLTIDIGGTAITPGFYAKANIGDGVAVAGQLDAFYDGGSARLEMTAGGEISAKPEVSVEPYFLAGVEITAKAGLDLYVDVDLPKFDVHLNGGGCGVVLGSCSSKGSSIETSFSSIDTSTVDEISEHVLGSSSTVEMKTDIFRSPFSLGSASAEYIVVDNSGLTVTNHRSLRLSGSAQQKIKALNIVNAMDSTVANGVNVSRNSQSVGNGDLMLVQSNVITHGM